MQQTRQMIDIHSHVLPFVDDGSVDMDSSLEIINQYKKQGVDAVILTPHYRGKFKLPTEEILEEFFLFSNRVKESGGGIDLYLGQEIFAGADINDLVENAKVLNLANSKYLLLEFDYSLEEDIAEKVYELSRRGYHPIVAHMERYVYADLMMAVSIKHAGGFIQVNADTILGKCGRVLKKKAKDLLRLGLVDFVASDVHCDRALLMKKAYKHVKRKFGQKMAENVFYNNAKKIIEG